MKTGVFSDTIGGASPEEMAARARALGVEVIQLRTDWAGLDLEGNAADRARARRAYQDHGVEVAALAGYTNLFDPDSARRKANRAYLERVISIASDLDTRLVVTEVGSYDSTWNDHPHNHTPDAWAELGEITSHLTTLCEREGVTLVYEPYVNTVLDSAHAARRLAVDIASPALAFVFDSASLTTAETIHHNRAITEQALESLRGHIALAHAGDVHYNDAQPQWLPLGWGDLDADTVLGGLATVNFNGALIVEHLPESLVQDALAFCRARLGHSHRSAGESTPPTGAGRR